MLLLSALVAVASLQIKKKFAKQYEEAEYKLKGPWYYIWPILAIVTAIYFMGLQFTQDPKMTGLSLILVPIAVGVYLFRKKKLEAGGDSLDEKILEGMNQ